MSGRLSITARAPPRRASIGLLLALPLLGACGASGDFGRVNPLFVDDNIHGWVGRDAARAAGVPVSQFPLTDDERLLRDLAYPLIEPPFDRARWYSIVNEYGVSHAFGWPQYEIAGYYGRLMATPYRSATARYSQLNTDIRNDTVRVPEFFRVARHVVDIDRKRRQSMGYVGALTPTQAGNAVARIAENELIVGWVQGALAERSAAYCYTLQHLVVATPTPMAVEVERSLTLLNSRILENRLIESPLFGPAPETCGPKVLAVPHVAAAVTK